MIRYNFLFFFLFFGVLSVSAQKKTNIHSVRFAVVDSTNLMLVSNVHLTIIDSAGIKTVDTLLHQGKALIYLNSGGTLFLSLTSAGYLEKKVKAHLHSKDTQLGSLLLEKENIQLDDISIKAIKKNIDFKSDRSIYTLSQKDKDIYPYLSDVIKKVPLVQINNNEGIKMRGESGMKIYLNGKPTNINPINAIDFLKTIPIGTVKRVEFISSTSAKFDSDGAYGIMNIITTTPDANGYYLSLAGKIGNLQNGANGFYSIKRSKLYLNAFLGTNSQKKVGIQDLTNSYFTDSATSVQRNTGDRDTHQTSPFFNFASTYEIDSSSSVNLALNYFNYHFSHNLNSTISLSNGITEQEKYSLKSLDTRKVNGGDLNLDYRKTFKDKSNILFAFQNFINREKLSYNNQTSNSNVISGALNDEKQTENTFQLDYSRELTKTTSLDLGFKAILRVNQSFSAAQETDNNIVVPNSVKLNELDYGQNIFASYASFSYDYKNYSAQLGLRAERSSVDAVSNGLLKFDSNTFNFFPSFSSKLKMDGDQDFGLKFSKKIHRPSVGILNPFLIQIDPQNNLQGNPNVLPELSYNAEISYSKNLKSAFLLLSPFFNLTDRSIRRFASTGTNSLINTFYNVGSERVWGVTLYLSKSFGNFEISTSFDGMYTSLIGKDRFLGIRNGGKNYSISGNFGWKLPSNYSLSGSCSFNSSSVGIQGREAGYSSSDITLSKKLLDNRLNINAVFSDFISANGIFRSTYSSSSFVRTEDYKYKTTSAALSISYDFGKSKYISRAGKKINNNDLKKAD